MTADLEDFERLAAALKRWLGELVIVGGWAHRLHHEHALAEAPAYAPLRTRDADVAFDSAAKLLGRIGSALAAAGFREDLSSDESPPGARYHLSADDRGFYAEFLTPLVGSGTRRDGSADATEARGGIVAQKVRHLEVLLVAPWSIPIGGRESKHLPAPLALRVANPVCFVVQKLLIHGDRKPRKRAQDVLYIHDTIQLFGGSLKELNELWRTQVKGTLTASQRKRVDEMRALMFSTVTDTIREAARIPADRSPRPQDVRDVCEQGLAMIISDDKPIVL